MKHILLVLVVLLAGCVKSADAPVVNGLQEQVAATFDVKVDWVNFDSFDLHEDQSDTAISKMFKGEALISGDVRTVCGIVVAGELDVRVGENCIHFISQYERMKAILTLEE